jgi:hypothetical protein
VIALRIPEGIALRIPEGIALGIPEGIALGGASPPEEDRAEGDVIARRPEPFDCAQDRLVEERRGNLMWRKVRWQP